ncbi:O-antigen ligase family protein [Marinobacter zhejiangensis]|uniref:O-Antigen ligase n=1 Tax=Marinobacter zhejiangensis TaxID=488535 RepID=A0A1I4SDC5_9GAMM|nr:O-antigen ligase family protein [Marinobacter zhejiangensis]SFM62334.1 O-Antigen ligase [Marinobacter zhejiangensis]
MDNAQYKGILWQARCLLALLPMIYVLTLMWWIPEGAKYVPGLALGSLLLYPLLGGRFERSHTLASSQKFLIAALWGVVIVGGVVYGLKGGGWKELRAWLAVALYLLVFRGLNINTRFLMVVLAVSAIGFGVHSLLQYTSGVPRVHGFINPIPYAVAVGAVSLVCLVQAVFGRFPTWQRIILAVAGVFAAVAVFMTRTRGVIIPFVVLIAGMLVVQYLLSHKGRISRSLMVGLLIVSGLVAVGASMMEGRIQQTMNEYDAIAEGNYRGSIGVRLQLWLSARHLAADAPVLGHGGEYRDALEELFEQGLIEESLYRFGANHFHNQYVDVLVKKGVLGLTALALLLLAAFKLALSSPSGDWRRYGGLVVSLLFVTAGLTDVPLLHAETIFLFLVLTAAISAVAPPEPRKATPSAA